MNPPDMPAVLKYTKVPQEQWGPFFDDFSRDKVGSPVTIEIETPGEGRHTLVRDATLVGITASTEHGRESTVQLVVGDRPQGHLSHTVRQPKRVTVIPADVKRFSLEIESESGEIAVVRWSE